LSNQLAFVDLNERWTHDDPNGQRYHFVRAKNESNVAAFYNTGGFIYRLGLTPKQSERFC
jgi:hypothetical protein